MGGDGVWWDSVGKPKAAFLYHQSTDSGAVFSVDDRNVTDECTQST